jgi:hypothetical protein
MANPAKEILGGKHIPAPKETKVSGYIESDVPRACGSCEYLEKGRLCRQRYVLRDSQIPYDKDTNLKIVDPVFGCCDYWQASDEAKKRAAKGEFEKALNLVVLE